jgi:hypothetical protein
LTVTLPGFEAVLVSKRPPDIVPSRTPVEVTEDQSADAVPPEARA